MSFKHTWMATQETDEAAILSRLGVDIIGEVEDFYGAPLTLARLPDGWLLIVSYQQPPFDEIAPMAVPDGFVLTGFMHEGVMVSEVRGFRDGAQEWAVVHDPDEDLGGVAVEGTPPPPFAEIYRKAKAEQTDGGEDIDYIFDVPVELSAAICGFTPNEDMDVTWFEVTKVMPQPAAKDRKGFFARLFGR